MKIIFIVMKEIQTEIMIEAPAGVVWKNLTTFDRYPDWNPFIQSISGDQHVGGRLHVVIQPPGGRPMTFTPKVLIWAPGREWRWKGKFIIPGLFDGEHYFILEPHDDQSTHLVHGEIFTGLLTGMLGGLLTNTAEGFRQLNVALKQRCEAEQSG